MINSFPMRGYTVALLGALAALCFFAERTYAHVTLEQSEAPAGSPYKATLRVPHGCGSSPTTKLRLRIPDGLIAVKPMPKAGWAIEMTKGPYGRTYSIFHGIQISEGVKEISWTGRLGVDFYDEFVLTGYLADALPAGTMLYFPVVQECEQGVERWIEVPSAGQEPQALRSPAPVLHIVAPRASSGATTRPSDSCH